MQRRNGSKHDKTGCLTCRHRHVFAVSFENLSPLLTQSTDAGNARSTLLPYVGIVNAWSAGHLASRENSYRPTELAACSKSFQSLVLSLSSCDAAKSGINAATSLILMISEVCLGFHTNWYSHLIGMKDIITAAHFPTSTSDSVLLGPWNGETKMRRKGELRHAFETRYRAGWV